MNPMIHSIEDELIEAFMTKTPLVIVEGIDDMKIYSQLCYEIGKKINIIAVELIKDYHEGCDGVIRLINDIQPLVINDERLKTFVLGIIDRDARFYRNQIPNIPQLLVLDYYSIESYFINDFNINEVIKFITRKHDDIDPEIIVFINSQIMDSLEYLYYASLEALRNACEVGYCSEVGYSYESGNVLNNDLMREAILAKRNSLDVFAESKGISFSFETIKKISKGKWLLMHYCCVIKRIIEQLKDLCESDIIPKCKYCSNHSSNKCQYSIPTNFQPSQIQSIALTKIDHRSLVNVIARIKLLSCA